MGKSSKIFAVGDIHGCLDELERLIQQLPLSSDDTIVFLGDYIDRGENSKKVVDYVLKLKESYKVITLIGNHESMFLEFLERPSSSLGGQFVFNGGNATLASYANNDGSYEIPKEHMDFFNNLETFYQIDDFFFVHAGVPDREIKDLDAKRDKLEMLWIRDRFLKSQYRWSKTIIHGHTVTINVEILDNRINLDTGCFFGGKLSAIELPDKIVHSVSKEVEAEHTYLKDVSGRVAVRFPGKVSIIVKKKGVSIVLDTINYSEFGFLLKDRYNKEENVFQHGETVQGVISFPLEIDQEFTGVIVRVEKSQEGIFYAIKVE